MSFWRMEVIDPILGADTALKIQEQLEWAAREPQNAQPFYHLGQLYRMTGRQEEGLALLLEAVRLDPGNSEAHLALTQAYAVQGDYAAAWRHARASQNTEAVALLERHGVPEPSTAE